MFPRILFLCFICVALLLGGCFRNQPEVIVITATFLPPTFTPMGVELPSSPLVLSPVPIQADNLPTLDPFPTGADPVPVEHVVQPGDTLSAIASRYNTTVQTLLNINPLPNPDILSVGQVLRLPQIPDASTPSIKLIPDSRFVRGPRSQSFDIARFISQQSGYIRSASDEVAVNQADGRANTVRLGASDIVKRVSEEYSIDPRLLLILLELRAGWLSQPTIPPELQTHPLISLDASGNIIRTGLYRQLSWAANTLNYGYYGWKYRGQSVLEFGGGERLSYAMGLNAGTIAVQYFLSQNRDVDSWRADLDRFYQLYYAYFGNPFQDSIEPLVPPQIVQPQFILPFANGETWFYTGGPHGGWGSGSAWAAIDLAPPDERTPSDTLCYVSDYWAIAVAPGIITTSHDGLVILDLDGDSDDTTGWNVIYLHLAEDGRIESGSRVAAGDPLGRPSCEGGFSNATHIHIGRRYNGEWLPADCSGCPNGRSVPSFNLGGWQIVGIPNQEYQGFMIFGDQQRQAEQGRLTPINRISWQ